MRMGKKWVRREEERSDIYVFLRKDWLLCGFCIMSRFATWLGLFVSLLIEECECFLDVKWILPLLD